MAGVERDTADTAVHRLVKEGVLFKVGAVRRDEPRPGRPPQLYALSTDPNTARRVRDEVAAFQSEQPSTLREPESPHYWQAAELLDQLEPASGHPAPSQVDGARQALALARRYEAMLDDGADQVSAYLDVAEGRADLLAGHLDEAERKFLLARPAFDASGLSEQVHRVDEYLAAVRLRRLAQTKAGLFQRLVDELGGLFRTPALAQTVRDVIREAAEALPIPSPSAPLIVPPSSRHPRGLPSVLAARWTASAGQPDIHGVQALYRARGGLVAGAGYGRDLGAEISASIDLFTVDAMAPGRLMLREAGPAIDSPLQKAIRACLRAEQPNYSAWEVEDALARHRSYGRAPPMYPDAQVWAEPEPDVVTAIELVSQQCERSPHAVVAARAGRWTAIATPTTPDREWVGYVGPMASAESYGTSRYLSDPLAFGYHHRNRQIPAGAKIIVVRRT